MAIYSPRSAVVRVRTPPNVVWRAVLPMHGIWNTDVYNATQYIPDGNQCLAFRPLITPLLCRAYRLLLRRCCGTRVQPTTGHYLRFSHRGLQAARRLTVHLSIHPFINAFSSIGTYSVGIRVSAGFNCTSFYCCDYICPEVPVPKVKKWRNRLQLPWMMMGWAPPMGPRPRYLM